ncbi:MAG: FapA family protein [Lachnospiraceae bacterium]|nr:FapA family protein [Lachnospiraceae bacterium]
MRNFDTDKNQQQELQFSMTENAEYHEAQNQEIKLGIEEGLDVSIYSNSDFNWLQMEQIRMGLKDKVDATIYANPAYSYETMRQIRLSLYSAMDLISYLNRGFTDEALEEIRLALLNKLPIDTWLKDDMCAPQIHEIRIGLFEQLDVSAYADSKYNWMQMQEIRLGLEKKLSVSLYTNYLYSHSQMKEIRLGLEAGLDVSSYCGLIYSASDMKEKRLGLINGKTSKDSRTKAKDSILDSFMKKEFVISIEENGNKAYAFIPWVPGNMVTKDDIYNDLERREIVFGIRHEAILDMIEKRRMNEKILIAEGIPAKKGKDGWFEFFVRLDLPRIPAPLPDGGVDYVNIEAFEMVDKGEKLAVYHPAEKGTNGKNIYGKTIHAEKGMEKKPLRGTGFMIAPDGVTYISKLNGKFEYINGRMIISNMLVVHEDVTSVTGKLEVDGSVYVVGSIYSGGYIKATGDIIIEHNVETARLIAGGNVMIKKGSCSKHDCFIEAGGEVSGKFFEAANINARGNVKANYIMNSNINTMGRVIVSGSKGVLLGGRICAVKGVDTFNLGNSSHLRTILEVGRNELYEKEQAEYAEKREQLLNELSALEIGRNKIIQLITAEKEVPEDMLRKVCATITVKSQELANLDAEVSKLANLTEQNFVAPVCVRGKAHVGSSIVINSIKYMLSMEVNRVIFKLRNKQVIIVTL